ncbi:unnamed protein product, partial [Mycena citricolor]
MIVTKLSNALSSTSHVSQVGLPRRFRRTYASYLSAARFSLSKIIFFLSCSGSPFSSCVNSVSISQSSRSGHILRSRFFINFSCGMESFRGGRSPDIPPNLCVSQNLCGSISWPSTLRCTSPPPSRTVPSR